MEMEAAERRKMVEMSRKSNFNIGEEAKQKCETYDTQSKVAYSFKQQAKSTTDVARMDFKVANFKFGSQLPKYVTTNSDTYAEQSTKERLNQMAKEQAAKNQRLKQMKMQQFVIGTETPEFSTEA
jgi:hypothetical protein